MTLTQWTDLARAIILALLVPGGPAVAWIAVRHRRKSPAISRDQVVEAEVSHVMSDPAIADRWHAYADDIETRLGKRLADAEKRLDAAEARTRKLDGLLDVYGVYSRTLRAWITDRKPPPPPPWPAAIDPSCGGWDYGDHITNHHPQEDS